MVPWDSNLPAKLIYLQMPGDGHTDRQRVFDSWRKKEGLRGEEEGEDKEKGRRSRVPEINSERNGNFQNAKEFQNTQKGRQKKRRRMKMQYVGRFKQDHRGQIKREIVILLRNAAARRAPCVTEMFRPSFALNIPKEKKKKPQTFPLMFEKHLLE